jgi:transcriptional regulator with XRE-family HTH domain
VAKAAGPREIDGQRVCALRIALNLSQGQLAELAGYDSYQSIQSIESGKSRRPTRLRELARALRTTEAYLLRESENPRPPKPVLKGTRPGSIPQIDLRALEVPGIAQKVPPFSRRSVLEYWTVPARLAQGRWIICVEVEGGWMSPILEPGDFVFVDVKDRTPPGVFLLVDSQTKTSINRIEPTTSGLAEVGGVLGARNDQPSLRHAEFSIIGRCLFRVSALKNRPLNDPPWLF